MSHLTVEVDENGYPIDIERKDEEKWMYVDEQICIGCRECASASPGTFFMEPEHGRARVYQQDVDIDDVLDTAIDVCPVNCISRITWLDLVTAEIKRIDQVVDPYANLFSTGGFGSVSVGITNSNKWMKQQHAQSNKQNKTAQIEYSKREGIQKIQAQALKRIQGDRWTDVDLNKWD